jgi:Leucine-rich repeat (LRR) protein
MKLNKKIYLRYRNFGSIKKLKIIKKNIKEFKLNSYITLKLESNRTNIYIKNQLFLTCKSIFLDLPKRNSQLHKAESIDEIINRLDYSLEHHDLSPNERFWAHCSNLQAWYESNYDTRILTANLAFPLLKKLAEEGDVLAKRVFKEEIARRIQSKYLPVIFYLIEEGYINYLSREEYLSSLLNEEDAENLLLIENKLQFNLKMSNFYDQANSICVEDGEIIALNLENIPLDIVILDDIMRLKNLRTLWLTNTDIEQIPDSIGNLKYLQELNLSNNKISRLPDLLNELKGLKKLTISKKD